MGIAKIAKQKRKNKMGASNLLKSGAASFLGAVDSVTPGRAFQTLNTNIRDPNVNYKGDSNTGFVESTLPLGTQAAGQAQTAATYSDPYAQYGGKANYDQLRAGFDSQKQGIYGSARTATELASNKLGGSILDFVDSIRGGQRNIDKAATQNYAAKIQGGRDVNAMVGRGIRSGNVMLSNKNASDSSAAGALAGAYGDIGRRELSKVGQQFSAGQSDVADQQLRLDETEAAGIRNLNLDKENAVLGILTSAEQSLAALDAAMQGASLPDRINLEAEKQAIKNEAIASLARHDAAAGVRGIDPSSPEARQRAANEQLAQGVAPEDAFDYLTETDTRFQGGGGGELPLFLLPRPREE